MNGYIASISWYRFVENNKRKVKPIHAAVIHWCYAVANEKKWSSEFQLPTVEACEMCGITDRETFHKALKDLSDFGAIKVLQESTGRYVARWVSLDLPEFYRPINSDRITEGDTEGTYEGSTDGMQDGTSEGIPEGTTEGSTTNYKSKETNKTIKPNKPEKEELNIPFEVFWEAYGNKKDKAETEKRWKRLTNKDRQAAFDYIAKYKASLFKGQNLKYPATYLSSKCWEDDPGGSDSAGSPSTPEPKLVW